MLRRQILGATTGLQTAPVYAYLGRMAAGKVILLVLDGVGIGELPDAARYGDEGSNTLGHTGEAVGGIQLASLRKLGLGNIEGVLGVEPIADPIEGHRDEPLRHREHDDARVALPRTRARHIREAAVKIEDALVAAIHAQRGTELIAQLAHELLGDRLEALRDDHAVTV